MPYRELYEREKKISAQYEIAIKALLSGNLEAYLMLKYALEFAEEQRKEIENDRRIKDLLELEEPSRSP